MTMAVVWSALVTAAVGWFFNQHLPFTNSARAALATPAGMGLFGMATILGSWAILASSKFWEGSAAEARQRRLIQTALGAAVGASAYWLQQTLLIDLGYHNNFPGLIKHISGVALLTDSPQQPSLAGYVLFFAALFGIRRWWWQADAFRSKRFRAGSLIFSGLVAFLVPAAFAFHQEWGMLWGVAISAVVQLSAPWIAPGERPALFEANRAA
jgi:hypothetical protein